MGASISQRICLSVDRRCRTKSTRARSIQKSSMPHKKKSTRVRSAENSELEPTEATLALRPSSHRLKWQQPSRTAR